MGKVRGDSQCEQSVDNHRDRWHTHTSLGQRGVAGNGQDLSCSGHPSHLFPSLSAPSPTGGVFGPTRNTDEMRGQGKEEMTMLLGT